MQTKLFKEKTKKVPYMNVQKMLKKKHNELEFKGEWLDLIGRPSQNWTAIIHGTHRSGKSTLILKLAQYYAEHFFIPEPPKEGSKKGAPTTVLYISAEELDGSTMQKKIRDLNITSPYIKFVPTRDKEIVKKAIKNSRAKLIIIDTVQKCGFTPDDLYEWQEQIKRCKTARAMIFIHQSDRAGNNKGGTEWAHDTDVDILCKDGIATSRSRCGALTSKMVIYKKTKDLFDAENEEVKQ